MPMIPAVSRAPGVASARERRADLIVVGDVMVDVSVRAGALASGGDVHGEVRIRPGGTGPNAAVWAASRGATVRLHGRVGDDLIGRLVRQELEARGVEVTFAVDGEARTGSMLVVRQDGERSMVADRGANARLSPQDLPGELEAGAVLVSGYLLFHPSSEPAARAALERARAPLVAIDAASWPLVAAYGAGRFLAATAAATLLLANEPEAEALTGRPAEEAAAVLAGRARAAAVKLGERGALLAMGGTVHRHQGSPRGARDDPDSTGAGDAFDGVLLAALAHGASPPEALEQACRAGAAAATGPDPWPDR